MSENMRYYDHARHVPDTALKAFNNGRFSGTDINPMWRIKTLTELFGPAGIGWYYEVISERSERLSDDTVIAIVDLNLYIKDGNEWSKPIYGTGGNQLVSKTKNGVSTSDEGYKMALTDALSVACKALGIGADVYYSNDKTKYTKDNQLPDNKPKPRTFNPNKGTVTVEQVDLIYQIAAPIQIAALEKQYGNTLERMSEAKAAEAIAKLKGEHNG